MSQGGQVGQTHTYEHTDTFGVTYRLTVELPQRIDFRKSDRGYLSGSTFVDGVWTPALAIHAALFPSASSLVAALADHDWHGSAFEEHFNPEGER